MRIDKKSIPFIVAAAVMLIVNITGAFILPEQIYTQISLNGSAVSTMNKYLYLVFSGVIIGVCSAVGIYLNEKRVRYLVVTLVLLVADIAVIVYNIV